jgi:C-terminal processing protease CtpA/Prc
MDSWALLYPVGQPKTSTGMVIEGRGVTPDLDVTLTREQLLAGHDTQLEAALHHLKP